MKILNYGSLNIDYVYSVSHIIAPGETLLAKERNIYVGGKGLNQSVALARAGATVYHAGKIGQGGQILKEYLQAAGAKTDYLQETETVETGHTMIQVDANGQNSIIVFGGSNQAMQLDEIDATLAQFATGDIILLQNEINYIPEIINKAYARGLKIAFNPSPITATINNYPLDKVSWFILNEIEGEQLTGQTEPQAIARSLRATYPNCTVVLTLGKDGVYFLDENEEFSQKAFVVEAVDTTAAGDTFAGYYLHGITAGLSQKEAIAKASLASALVVTRTGAAPSIPTQAEVTTFAKEQGLL